MWPITTSNFLIFPTFCSTHIDILATDKKSYHSEVWGQNVSNLGRRYEHTSTCEATFMYAACWSQLMPPLEHQYGLIFKATKTLIWWRHIAYQNLVKIGQSNDLAQSFFSNGFLWLISYCILQVVSQTVIIMIFLKSPIQWDHHTSPTASQFNIQSCFHENSRDLCVRSRIGCKKPSSGATFTNMD